MHGFREIPAPGVSLQRLQHRHGHSIADDGNDVGLLALGKVPDHLGFEIELDLLLARELPRASAMSKYPSVRRDLAFVVPESVSWAAMQATVKQAAGESLRNILLFDRYAGKGVENGFKSLAMGLILQDQTRTLTDRDVEAVVTEVVAALEREHGAAIRR